MSIEFPFASVIRSKNIYPEMVSFFEFCLFENQFLSVRVVDLFLAIWIVGSIYFLYRICRQEIAFKKRMSEELPTQKPQIYSIMNKVTNEKSHKVRIIESSMIEIPMVTGFIKPTIYLPCISLSDIELYNILQHEWTHYIHKDIWIKLFVKIICAIYWWNPFIYLLKKDIDNALEVKSDLYVTSKMSHEEKLDYLETILKIAKSIKKKNDPISPSGLGMMSNKKNNSLKQRFEFVLECKFTNMIKNLGILLSILMIFLFLSSYFFVIQPYSSPQECEAGTIFDISPDNSFLVKNKNGIYNLYVNNVYMCNIEDIKDVPFSLLEIKELEE